MSFIKDLQQKPEKTRKKILLISVIFVTIVLISLWILQFKNSISKISPALKDLPRPEVPGEDLKSVGEAIKELKDINSQDFQGLNELN
jgi:hypothetical protein